MAHYSDDGGFVSVAALMPSNHKHSSTSHFVMGILQPKLERNMPSKVCHSLKLNQYRIYSI